MSVRGFGEARGEDGVAVWRKLDFDGNRQQV